MTLDELGMAASQCDTAMAHAMTLAVLDACLHGSAYGFERG